MADPENAALFAAEVERRKKAGEDPQVLEVPDKGKGPATRSTTASKPPTVGAPRTSGPGGFAASAPPGDVLMRDAIVSGKKRGATSDASPASKRQLFSAVLPLSDQAALDAEYERSRGLPEVERVGEIHELHQRVSTFRLFSAFDFRFWLKI